MICVHCMFYEAHGADVYCWRCALMEQDPRLAIAGYKRYPLDRLTAHLKKEINKLFPRKETHGE